MSTKNKLHILGCGEWLGYAQAAAQELNRWESFDVTVLEKINDYSYDLQDFQVQDPNSEYFLALGDDAFGTVREKHLSDLVSRGLRFTSLMPEHYGRKINCLISPGVIITNDNLSIGFNTFIGPNSIIGNNNILGRSVTIGANAILQENIVIEKNVSLANGTQVSSDVNIVNYVSIQKKMEITVSISKKIICSNLFERSVCILGN